jgi:hypothetical protein
MGHLTMTSLTSSGSKMNTDGIGPSHIKELVPETRDFTEFSQHPKIKKCKGIGLKRESPYFLKVLTKKGMTRDAISSERLMGLE